MKKLELLEVSIEGIKEYRRREREAWNSWIPARRTWFDMLDNAAYWDRHQALDHRMMLNWTWEAESIRNCKWEEK